MKPVEEIEKRKAEENNMINKENNYKFVEDINGCLNLEETQTIDFRIDFMKSILEKYTIVEGRKIATCDTGEPYIVFKTYNTNINAALVELKSMVDEYLRDKIGIIYLRRSLKIRVLSKLKTESYTDQQLEDTRGQTREQYYAWIEKTFGDCQICFVPSIRLAISNLPEFFEEQRYYDNL